MTDMAAGELDSAVLPATRPSTHPIRRLLFERVGYGLLTLVAVSVIVFAATEVLPGNAAYAVLGHTATPASLHALEQQLGLKKSVPSQYWSWLSGVLQGHFGYSLVAGGSGLGGGGAARETVASLVGPRLVNSAFLVVVSGVIGTLIGVGLGLWAALRRDGWIDHALSVVLLTIAALPESCRGHRFVDRGFAAPSFGTWSRRCRWCFGPVTHAVVRAP